MQKRRRGRGIGTQGGPGRRAAGGQGGGLPAPARAAACWGDGALTGKKAFLLSFLATLGVLAPVYALALFFSAAQQGDPAAAVAGAGVGVAVRRPDAGDSRNLLVQVTTGSGDLFALLRFDALQGKVCVASLPAGLALPGEGGPATLGELSGRAGPGVAARQLAGLLGVRVDHYLRLSDELAARLGGQMGNITLDLDRPELQQLGGVPLAGAGGSRAVLSATGALALLQGADTPQVGALRAEVYSAFLLAGMDRLNQILPDFLRGDEDFSTDILATDIYDYQRILDYLALQQPEMLWARLETAPAADGSLQPTGAALELMKEYFE